MQKAERPQKNRQKTVGLKAIIRIADAWGIDPSEAAALAAVPLEAWTRIRDNGFDGDLSEEQLLRISALTGIYQALETYFEDPISKTWFSRPNDGPLFNGKRPVETAIEGGLPQLLAIRRYLDALLMSQ